MSRKILHTTLIGSLFFISSCKLFNRDETVSPNENANFSVLGYFLLNSWAVDDSQDDQQSFRNELSHVLGYTFAATKNSTFESWSNPELGCRGYNEASFEALNHPFISTGKLFLKHESETSWEIKETAYNSGSIYRDYLHRPDGIYSLKTSGNAKELYKFDTNFEVLASGASISFQSGNNPVQPSSSPVLNPNQKIEISRSQDLRIAFTAPEGTQTVKISFKDFSLEDQGFYYNNFICFTTPDEEFLLAAEILENNLVNTQNGAIRIEFMKNHLEFDQGSTRELLIQASTIHHFGLYHHVRENEFWGDFGQIHFTD